MTIVKLLHLLRHRQLAYDLLREYEVEHDREPIDLAAWRTELVESGRFAVRTDSSGKERWQAAIDRALALEEADALPAPRH